MGNLNPTSLRKRAGLSQRQVAQELDIRSQTVADWEKGRVPRLPPSKLKRLCEIYNCTLDDLIDAFENPDQSQLGRDGSLPARSEK
ncbi:MAG: XRE family transcriptional regulator [Hapalosiphonaceae cyanobacterium JJU2]|nr:MAG: XRE family transcriptional regulator [Hapalosiphonaceae cyanobacterium JJU2]